MTHGTEPDWEALAEDYAARSRRSRRLRWAGVGLLAAGLLGGVLGIAVPKDRDGGHAPTAGASPPSPSTAADPAVPGRARLLPDQLGRSDLALGPDALVDPVPDGHALRLPGSPGSYAQSADRVVNIGTSFTVSVWVYDTAGSGTRSAISQGDGISSAFDLGRDDTDGRQSWVFRVRTADGTAVEALAPADGPTAGRWVLLTGVHDAGRHAIALQVDGAQVATAQVPAIRPDGGPLQLGRVRRHGGWADYWAGAVACVEIFNEALDPGRNGGPPGTRPISAWLVD